VCSCFLQVSRTRRPPPIRLQRTEAYAGAAPATSPTASAITAGMHDPLRGIGSPFARSIGGERPVDAVPGPSTPRQEVAIKFGKSSALARQFGRTLATTKFARLSPLAAH